MLGGVVATVGLVGNPDFSTVSSVPAHLFALARGGDPTAARLASEAKTRDALLELMDGGGLVLTSDDVITLYYLGRFDALLRPSGLGVSQPGREVDRDTRTGAPIIRTGETLRRVLACHPKGLAIVWSHEWRVSYGVTPELADIIEAEMQELKLPGTLKVRAFRWNGDSSSGVICRPDYGGLQVPTAEAVPHTMSGSK